MTCKTADFPIDWRLSWLRFHTHRTHQIHDSTGRRHRKRGKYATLRRWTSNSATLRWPLADARCNGFERSSEEAQQLERRQCRSRVVYEAGGSLFAWVLRCPSRSVRNGVKKGGDREDRVLGECRPAWSHWEGVISETCGRCSEGEGWRGIPFV